MIEFLKDSNGNTLIAKATNKLTVDDYEKIFIPKLNELLDNYKKIKIVFYFTENFKGWELGAAWDDAKFGINHRNDMEKIAVVGGPKWVEWCTKLSKHFFKCEIKHFDVTKLEEAINWIK